MSSHGSLSTNLLNTFTITTFTSVEFEIVVIYIFIIFLPRGLNLEVKLLRDAHGIFSKLEVAIVSLLLLAT